MGHHKQSRADKRRSGHAHTFCAPRVGSIVARIKAAASRDDAVRTMATREWSRLLTSICEVMREGRGEWLCIW